MHKDEKGNFIGNGEDAAFEILKQLFPTLEIKRQVKFKELLHGEWLDTLTERQEKETIDIVVYSNPILAVRVQDPRHSSNGLAQRDLVQRKTLEWNNVKVVDLYHYECKNLMKDVINQESKNELIGCLKSEGVYVV